jgi:hypothetical protein
MKKNIKSEKLDDAVFEERWNTIFPQAVEFFEFNMMMRYEENPDEFEEDPNEWLEIEDIEDKFEFIINDEYWVGRWSLFLLKMLIDEIYKNEGGFSVN